MPATTLDYLPISKKVLLHWGNVETASGSALLLKDGTTRKDFEALKDRLEAIGNSSTAEQNDRQRAQQTRDLAIGALHPLTKQARTTVQGLSSHVAAADALPKVPPIGSDPQKYLAVARDIEEILKTLNATLPTPVAIPIREGEVTAYVTLAEFSAAIDAYEAAADALALSQSAETLGRKTRDGVHKLVKEKVLLYPTAARGRLAVGDPLRDTIPTLTGR